MTDVEIMLSAKISALQHVVVTMFSNMLAQTSRATAEDYVNEMLSVEFAPTWGPIDADQMVATRQIAHEDLADICAKSLARADARRG